MELIHARGFIGKLYKLNHNGVKHTMYRIINPLANPNTLNKYPVLYGHGVLYDAMSMISRSEKSRPRRPVLGQPTIDWDSSDGTDDYSLPFMFSNNNFDVWLYDARGTNSYNRNLSATLDPRTAQSFWDFSLDEQALIDLPFLMDFVLQETGATKLVYVSFSESTWFMFSLLSYAPQYQNKVAAFVAFAPVAYVSYIKGLTLPILISFGGYAPDAFNHNYLPQPVIDAVDISLRHLCSAKALSHLICAPLVHGVAGFGSGEMDPNFFNNFYKSTSVRVIKHFIQMNIFRRYSMYDFGTKRNLAIYGRPTPPLYNLGNIKLDRIILGRGLTDFLSTPQDQARLIAELGAKPYMDLVLPEYNHFDFIDGKNLIKLVNAPVMRAVYELIYKDGPNILKSPTQIEASKRSELSHFKNPTSPIESIKTSGPGVGDARKDPLESTLPVVPELLHALTGGGGILEDIRQAATNQRWF